MGRGTAAINPWGSVKRRLRLQSPHGLIAAVPLPHRLTTSFAPSGCFGWHPDLCNLLDFPCPMAATSCAVYVEVAHGEIAVGRGTGTINSWGDWSRRRRFTEPHGLIGPVPRPSALAPWFRIC